MRWPSPQDYREAIQTLATSVSDEELRAGEIAVDALQLPVVNSGQYAAVFKITSSPAKAWAVRCFLHNFPDRQERYKKISQFVLTDELECTVDFELLDKGIRVGNDWFPLLKMEYVSGLSFGRYVRENIKNPAKLRDLLHQFKAMMTALKSNGIAHGDLQHDNIVVTSNGSLRLIDYDGMFVPDLKGWHSNELGHRNYQHPQRSELDFGPQLDNFSAWLIVGALECLISEPKSHRIFQDNDEAFFLCREDFIAADSSKTLHELEDLGGKCKEFSRQIRTIVRIPCSSIPYLNEKLEVDKALKSITPRKLPAALAKKTEIETALAKKTEIETGWVEAALTPRPGSTSLPIYSLEDLKYSKGELNCFPSKLLGTVLLSHVDAASKQEFLQKMSENLKPGETIVWSGGLNPMKLSSGQQSFQAGGSLNLGIAMSTLVAGLALTIFTSFSGFFIFGIAMFAIILGGASGNNSSGEHKIYALTEKNLKIGLRTAYRPVNAENEAFEVDLVSVDVPLKQIKLALFYKGSEKLEERVQLRIEVPSKDHSNAEIRSLWLHGFTVKERLALLTRLRSLGVQCSVPS